VWSDTRFVLTQTPSGFSPRDARDPAADCTTPDAQGETHDGDCHPQFTAEFVYGPITPLQAGPMPPVIPPRSHAAFPQPIGNAAQFPREGAESANGHLVACVYSDINDFRADIDAGHVGTYLGWFGNGLQSGLLSAHG